MLSQDTITWGTGTGHPGFAATQWEAGVLAKPRPFDVTGLPPAGPRKHHSAISHGWRSVCVSLLFGFGVLLSSPIVQ